MNAFKRASEKVVTTFWQKQNNDNDTAGKASIVKCLAVGWENKFIYSCFFLISIRTGLSMSELL